MRATLAGSCVLAILLIPVFAAAQPPIPLPGLDATGRIERDFQGIPHISATSEHDLFFLQGWVHAEDRLFQMDLNRRQPSGTLAELVEPPALGGDVELRTIGLRRAAERSLPILSPRSRNALQAYAEGVNAWVVSHPLPVEYAALEIASFEPWTPIDSVVIAKVIAFSLSFDLDIGLTEILLTYQGTGNVAGFDGTALFFEDLFRSQPFDSASTVPDAMASVSAAATAGASTPSLIETARGASALISPETLALAREYLDRARQVPLLKNALAPGERVQGSNEWAVAGRHTESGRPILANDPHLALNTPSTFYQIHLRSFEERIDVIGSGFPGVPFVILGQNRKITWGATTNPMDVTDTFLEQVVPDATSPSGLSTVYQGGLEAIIPIPQVFRYNQIGDAVADNLALAVPGTPVGGVDVPPVTLIVPRRNQGPILALDTTTGAALSVQYTGFSATREIEAFRVWNRARNLDEFVFGLQLFDFGSQNWAYADFRGFIAYFTSGEMPVREDLQAGSVNGLPPFFIRDGTGGNEWLPVANPQLEQSVPFEILPFDEMPQVINPPTGYFVNANNDPAGTTLDNNAVNQLRPGGGIYYLNPGYSFGTRAGRITQALRERLSQGKVDREDLKAIQADTVLLDAQAFVPHILQAHLNAAEPGAPAALADLAANPGVAEAIGRLAAWDFTTPTGIPQGFDSSDVDGERSAPAQTEIDYSVAATVYSVWRGQMIKNTFDLTLDALSLPRPGSQLSMTALRNLLDNFDQNHGVGASGLEWFDAAAPPGLQPEEKRDIVLLQSLHDALDLLAGDDFAPAFDHSVDQSDYRWGKLHRIVLDHPLGGPFNVPPAGGGFPPPLPGLDGIPVDGGFGVVDASSHSARADGANDFMFGSGPVRRYLGQPGPLTGTIQAETSMPGGESGVLGSPFFANLLPRWLTNDTHPVRQEYSDYRPAIIERRRFVPAP